MIGGELLRDHAAERKAQDVKSCQAERAAEFDTGLGHAATVDGVSPEEPPMPG